MQEVAHVSQRSSSSLFRLHDLGPGKVLTVDRARGLETLVQRADGGECLVVKLPTQLLLKQKHTHKHNVHSMETTHQRSKSRQFRPDLPPEDVGVLGNALGSGRLWDSDEAHLQ